MNNKYHSVAFTKDQLDLLQLLSRNDLVTNIHLQITAAGLAPKRRTMGVLGKMDLHVGLLDVLRWRQNDTGRAFRSISTATVVRLMELVTGAVSELMDDELSKRFALIGPTLYDALQKALESEVGQARNNLLGHSKPAQA